MKMRTRGADIKGLRRSVKSGKSPGRTVTAESTIHRGELGKAPGERREFKKRN